MDCFAFHVYKLNSNLYLLFLPIETILLFYLSSKIQIV